MGQLPLPRLLPPQPVPESLTRPLLSESSATLSLAPLLLVPTVPLPLEDMPPLPPLMPDGLVPLLPQLPSTTSGNQLNFLIDLPNVWSKEKQYQIDTISIPSNVITKSQVTCKKARKASPKNKGNYIGSKYYGTLWCIMHISLPSAQKSVCDGDRILSFLCFNPLYCSTWVLCTQKNIVTRVSFYK